LLRYFKISHKASEWSLLGMWKIDFTDYNIRTTLNQYYTSN